MEGEPRRTVATLKRQLGFWEGVALSVGIMAPTAAMALNGALAASIAGTAVGLAFLGALVTIILVSYSFIEFSRQYAHAGSVYVFNGVAFGPRMGFLSGWSLLLTYTAFTAASTAEVGLFFGTLSAILGVSLHWFIPSAVAGVLIWWLAHREIQVSTRTTLGIEIVSVGLILVLALAILGQGGESGVSVRPFSLGGAGASAIALASVFAFLSFAGFEGAATLGEETAEPTRSIPRAIAAAVFFTGTFYLLVSYAQAVGFGSTTEGAARFAESSSPLSDLAQTYIGRAMAVAIAFGATISAFASALGTANAGSRILYALGRDGFGPKALGSTHARFASPYIAVAVVMTIDFVVNLALITQDPGNIFGWLGTIGVLSLLLVYLVTQVAAMSLFKRIGRWRGPRFVIPVAAIVLLAYTLLANVYPVPAFPFNLFPYVVLAWLLVGAIVMLTRPDVVRRIGEDFTNRRVQV
jgi:amino acid transporter